MNTKLTLKTKYLIVGGSAGGISAANMLAKLEPDAQVMCVTAESTLPYNKCFLVDWLTGDKTADQLQLRLNPQVILLTALKVVSLDVHAKIANLSDGQAIVYEKVLLAIGVQAFRPNIFGLDLRHVFAFHDYHDVLQIADFIKINQPKNAVVIGAGLTGLECADALVRCGLKVSMLERTGQILGKLVDVAGAHYIMQAMQAQGVDLQLNASVAQINQNQVILDSGVTIAADLVILAAGVRPNKLPILNGELACFGNYVVVNNHLQTNLVDIWAVGDMVVLPDFLTNELVPSCSWPDAMMQGNYAAQNMAGPKWFDRLTMSGPGVTMSGPGVESGVARSGSRASGVGQPAEYPGLFAVANSHFFGQDFISFGKLDAPDGVVKLVQNNTYQKVVTNQAGLVQAACLIGDVSLYPVLKRAVMTKSPVVL